MAEVEIAVEHLRAADLTRVSYRSCPRCLLIGPFLTFVIRNDEVIIEIEK